MVYLFIYLYVLRFERGIWSDIFPLALRSDQAYSLCKNWLNTEVQLPPLPSDDVQPCPCTLDQALLDIVRFQPDPDCNMFNRNSQFSRTGNCLHRRDAAHCIRLTDLGLVYCLLSLLVKDYCITHLVH